MRSSSDRRRRAPLAAAALCQARRQLSRCGRYHQLLIGRYDEDLHACCLRADARPALLISGGIKDNVSPTEPFADGGTKGRRVFADAPGKYEEVLAADRHHQRANLARCTVREQVKRLCGGRIRAAHQDANIIAQPRHAE